MSDETDFETCFEMNDRGQVQRLDVIESAQGKRQWTPEARAQIIAESPEPGANVSAMARRHGLFPQQLYTWRVGLRERAEPMTFALAMVERGKVEELSSAAVPPVSGQIVVEASGLLIRIPPDVSADHIERVLLAARVSA